MTDNHVFDPHLETANRWLRQLAAQLGLTTKDYPRALRALRAGLHAIRDRLPTSEVVDLAAQLPIVIRGIYYEGWSLTPKRIRDRATVIAQVQAELEPDQRLDAIDVLRAVVRLLVDHVTPGEIAHVVATLPRPIAVLWHELAPLAMPPTATRTGYVR